MKALELLKADRDYCLTINNDKSIIQKYDEAIEELEYMQKDIARLKEYKQILYNYNIDTYRCKCGALGRVGYLCSNNECNEV